MSDSAIGAPAPRVSAPTNTPASAPPRSTGDGLLSPGASGGESQDSPFGPAVKIGGAPPSSVFTVYTANGTFGPSAADQPAVRVAAPTVDFSHSLPRSTMYERLGKLVYQIQLAMRGGGQGGAYTLGYSLVV
jgi:hypothetical protein